MRVEVVELDHLASTAIVGVRVDSDGASDGALVERGGFCSWSRNGNGGKSQSKGGGEGLHDCGGWWCLEKSEKRLEY